jgi:Na+/melibiose symporter-like transporter
MIAADVAAALLLATVPAASAAGVLSVWWIFAVIFCGSTIEIFFEASEFGAIPTLVARDQLVSANGRIHASYAAASVLGPLAAGALVAFLPLEDLLVVDAVTFLLSAFTLSLIRRRFSQPRGAAARTMRADIAEGLRYVLSHPVLRNISAMMALINFINATWFAQIILFAKRAYGATDSQVALFFAGAGVDVVLCSLAAGPLRRRFSFGNVALGALMLDAIVILAMALTPTYAAGVVLWSLSAGLGTLFNINTFSLRQAIVPENLLGRIITIARMLAFSATPLGAIIGGLAIQWSGNVALVYAATATLTFAVAVYFRLASPLGRAERYLEAITTPS